MIIHAWDPGETTGYCAIDTNFSNRLGTGASGKIQRSFPSVVLARTFVSVSDVVGFYRQFSTNFGADKHVFAIEKFRLFPGSVRQHGTERSLI